MPQFKQFHWSLGTQTEAPFIVYYNIEGGREMYLDLFDELRLNKRLCKLVGFEVAAYWAELQSILKQVVKKKTADEQGFFTLDREYVERETTLTINKQLKCEDKLIAMGVIIKDPDNPNRLAISVNNMVEIITDEDTQKLRKSTKATKEEAKAAKVEGIKQNMKRFITEEDPEIKIAYELWIDGMIDAANCKFTKAVVQLFEKTVTEYTTDKATRLKIIAIATASSYRDANWAIEKLGNSRISMAAKMSTASKLPAQKICEGVSDGVIF
jgi:hypothetical protein